MYAREREPDAGQEKKTCSGLRELTCAAMVPPTASPLSGPFPSRGAELPPLRRSLVLSPLRSCQIVVRSRLQLRKGNWQILRITVRNWDARVARDWGRMLEIAAQSRRLRKDRYWGRP